MGIGLALPVTIAFVLLSNLATVSNDAAMGKLHWWVLLAPILVFILTPVAGLLAGRWSIGIQGEEHRFIPLLGGLPIYLVFTASVVWSGLGREQISAILIASTLIFIAGLINDVRGPRLTRELLFQITAIALLVRAGIVLTFLPESWWGVIGTWLLTFLWVWSISVAFRFLNGLDGLAAGSAAINGLFFGVYAFATEQPQLALLALVLMAASLGFLPYNYKPLLRQKAADVLLGDAGALYLGFVLAVLAVTGAWARTSLKDLMVPLLILAVPVFYTIYVTILGLRNGQFTFGSRMDSRKSRKKVDVHLLSLGIRRKEAVAILYLVNFCLGISAFLLEGSSLTDAFLILGQVTIFFGIIGYAIAIMKSRRSKATE